MEKEHHYGFNMLSFMMKTLITFFLNSSMLDNIWYAMCRWCKLSSFMAYYVIDLLNLPASLVLRPSSKLLLQAIFLVSCWCIWKARIGKIFKNINNWVSELLSDIISLLDFRKKIERK